MALNYVYNMQSMSKITIRAMNLLDGKNSSVATPKQKVCLISTLNETGKTNESY